MLELRRHLGDWRRDACTERPPRVIETSINAEAREVLGVRSWAAARSVTDHMTSYSLRQRVTRGPRMPKLRSGLFMLRLREASHPIRHGIGRGSHVGQHPDPGHAEVNELVLMLRLTSQYSRKGSQDFSID